MKKTVLLIETVLLYSTAITPVCATEVSSWAELNGAAADESIVLTNDIQAEGTPKIISLNADTPQTVDGANHSLTGANGFYIKKTAGNNLTIQNFGSVTDGTADDCDYSYIDAEGNTVYKKITNSVSGFNNTPFAANSLLLQNFTLSNMVFSNNSKVVVDAWLKEFTDAVSITDTVFHGNTNSADEGAILLLRRGMFTIDNLIFDSNAADQGIEFYSGTTTNITNSIFSNNTQSDSSYWDDYGTLQLSGGVVNIDNSQFINNLTGHADGGAISVTGGGLKEVSNSIFRGNSAPRSLGGAIWLSFPGIESKARFSNVTFEDNHAASGGGLVGWDQGNIYINDSMFKGNSVSGSSVWWSGFTELGGGLLLVETDSVITNTSFENNTASVGGGILTSEANDLFVIDTSFSGNTAAAGGAIYAANTNLNIYADTKDVLFSENIATDSASDFNAGSAVFFESSDDESVINLNAASDKKIIFDDTIAAYNESEGTSTFDMNINKSDLSYKDFDGTNITIDNVGEIQFNNQVADENGKIFNINLYGGKLSIGQGSTSTNPDGLINNNNFTVAGASTLNTANGVIGEFAPQTFNINAALDYEFDLDLADAKSDKLVGATNNASLLLSRLNIITDTEEENVKVTYSDTNIGGQLKDGYTITTSTARYGVTAENDETGSYLLISREPDLTGLAYAVDNGSATYAITGEADEVVELWGSNSLKADLAINGNGQGIKTENGLDGINVGSAYTLAMNNVADMSGFNYAFFNEGKVELTNTTITDNIINNGTLDINEGVALTSVTGSGTININADHEINTQIGDASNVQNINLNGGKLSIGQNTTATNPDGLLNANNFTVAGAAILNTANGVIGEFAPNTFAINSDLQYEFDLDLANAESDKLTGATNNGTLTLSTLNIITDTEEKDVKVTYSDTNIGGQLKDDYIITTSTASYDITAGNDDTGSYLLVSKVSELGGLPYAVDNGSDAYSITNEADEVVEAWGSNSLKADLAINGNGYGIKTENGLDGINVGSAYTLAMNNVTDMSGFNYAVSNEGKVELTNTTITDNIINNGTLDINEGVALTSVTGAGAININADYEVNTAGITGNTINLKAGTLSIGQNSTATNPDGLLNDNNFTVAGAATLNTANGVIGEFAPQTFDINAALDYEFDLDLADAKSDKLVGATNNASLLLSRLNIISDTDEKDVKVTYSDTNIGGQLKDGYTITTSTASYDITAENDDTGSYLLVSKVTELSGLPYAIQNGSDAYSITSGEDEVVEAWGTNDLQADLAINGNGYGIKTENGLDGINVGSAYTLAMNNVTDMSGFNYAVSNEGKVELTNTTISGNIINNGTLDINEGVVLGTVTGTGIMNVNADYVLSSAVSGNTVNVNGVKISGADNLAADTTLNVIGGTLDLGNQTANVKTASFDADSSLLLSINSLSDHGHLVAQNISVSEGAKLQATLAQGLVNVGETASLQLLAADNSDFNNFADSFDNKMYHFEKADKNGKYNISLTKTAEDVVLEDGGAKWVAGVAKAYVDSNTFESGTVGSDIANKLAALAQNDADALISEIKSLTPSESPVIHDHVMNDSSRLFRAVDSYLRGYRDPMGVSAGDVFSDVSIWAKPYIGKSKVSTGDVFEKQKSYNKGIIAGIQKKIIPNLDIGLGAHYDETEIDMYRRDLDVETVSGFVYGEYRLDNWFVNMLTSYGLSDYDEERSALGTMYKASYDVYTTTFATTVGYQFKSLIPEVGMRYYHVRRRGYKDSADQYVHKSNTNYARAVAGVRYTQDFGKISPEVYLGLSYDVKSPNDNTFVDLSNGSSYIVRGENLPRLEYEFNLGLNTYLNDHITLGTSFMGAYRKDYQEYTGIVRLKYDF